MSASSSAQSAGHRLRVEFCGEWTVPEPDRAFFIGRDADLCIDENPYLHRRFLRLDHRDGMWWLANVGTQLSATLADDQSRVHAWLYPGSRLPVLFATTAVRFTAGPTTYELCLHVADAPFTVAEVPETTPGTTTLGGLHLVHEQRLLVLALAEPALRRGGSGAAHLPTSAEAAARLGWPITKFNRKLDNVCQKLQRSGVRGLHGDTASLATTRRARLVDHALSAGLVSTADLSLLDVVDEADPP